MQAAYISGQRLCQIQVPTTWFVRVRVGDGVGLGLPLGLGLGLVFRVVQMQVCAGECMDVILEMR